ncbi:hypothetical protein [Sporosarcina obsidiansis]|uniref:hypothetical protein n=1 Tax=Sporosarcina obsidiansis TaxID=2660748 RepID=UPI00129BDC5D|nr:hypothetical protein [Sporosarcina obsidiansis]
MFFTKQRKVPDETSYNVGVFTTDSVDEETYDEWFDQLADAADNVGTAEYITIEGYNSKQLEILHDRFPTVNLKETFFLINEIDFEAIKEEIKLMESTQKWKKFFNQIPLGDYIAAENRVVLDASKAVFCTNDLQEAIQFLMEQAAQQRGR